MNELAGERLILIAEDNPDHLSRIRAALDESSMRHQIVTIASSTAALDYLYRRGEFVDAPRPDLILLDLNLSGNQGRNLLSDIKANPQFKRIPIVILTLSSDAADIFDTYSLQGNCYVIKSADLDQLFHIVKRIEEFWFGIVTLPTE